jgi:hypothetical protein
MFTGFPGYSFPQLSQQSYTPQSPVTAGRTGYNVPQFGNLFGGWFGNSVSQPQLPGVNIFQQGIGNRNIAIGTPGNDQFTQQGFGALFLSTGLGGSDRFSVEGDGNVAVLRGGNGNDSFVASGNYGFYKVYGGRGNDSLTLQGKATDWVQQDANNFYNATTQTRVFVSGVEHILYQDA